MWFERFLMRKPLPWGAGRIRLRVVAASTFTDTTNSSPLSARRSFFCSQLAIAERRSFSTGIAASLFENLNTPNALNTSIPRIVSTIKRILRGELGTFRNLAKETFFRDSFLASADTFFLLPILYLPFYYFTSYSRHVLEIYVSVRILPICALPCFQ